MRTRFARRIIARRWITRLIAGLTIGLTPLSVAVLPVQIAGAAPLKVTNCNAAGPGSLVGAVSEATTGATITFATSCPTITVTDGIYIDTNLTIKGPGAANLAVSGDNSTTVFWVATAATVTISGLTVEDGLGSFSVPHGPASNGGGIFNDGILTIKSSTVTNNNALDGFGGGIYNAGTLTVKDSSVSDNTAGEAGGGIYNFLSATVTHSTLTNNVAGFAGGDIYNSSADRTTLSLANTTLMGNSSTYGSAGGIYNLGTVAIKYSTLSDNSAVSNAGAIESDGGAVSIKGSSFSNNTDFAGDIDPGIYILGGTLTVKRTTFS